MKRYLHNFLKYNRSNGFIKWMVLCSYILIVFSFADVILLFLVSDKKFSGPLVVCIIALLALYLFIMLKMRSQLKPWINFGGAKTKTDDYSAPKTEAYKFSKEAAAVIEERAKDNGMSPEDYLLSLVRVDALSNLGYTSLTEYLNNVRQDNDKVIASAKILKDAKKGIKD